MAKAGVTSRLRIGAPSMVYGFDLLENVNTLSRTLNHVEIVLFHTPERHNFPTSAELAALRRIGAGTGLAYSVHLPSSFEIAADDDGTRRDALERTIEMIRLFQPVKPDAFVLHIPYTSPTLVAEPGCYFTEPEHEKFNGWSERAVSGLETIQNETALGRKLLVENINYSPAFLEPFWQKGLCNLCLDIGHLLLGGEGVRHYLRRYLPVTAEIHLHGVIGLKEHLALNVLPKKRVGSWIDLLAANHFSGTVNIEVFDPEDLALSIEMLNGILFKPSP